MSCEAGRVELLDNASPHPTRSTSGSIDAVSRLVPPAPLPTPETVSLDQSGSDTESEHDHVFDAYTLGCADGRAQGRNDALKLSGEMGSDAATAVAERVLELNRAFRDPENRPTHVPLPNELNGCVLSPQTRKRIAPELPPLHIIEQRLKRYKEARELGTLAELLAE
ncbi:hypothetical protein TRAPUB_4667 [Trametes pubescens]|uniref:Uncharacterized protein n=1 Tax=Trametes pubescens TaxID=154538 RepID=A0A1M2VAJ9_TRAPU|nr:hypothetical protein TRAPUB_4667 [Trametes pubescens]